MEKVLLKDIVIPAGTVFRKAAERTERVGEGHWQCVIGLSDNTTGDFTYYLDDDYPDEATGYFTDLK